ncbi:unnamed protein product [Cylindrotheca closterium]|uniref:RING-type domain-containing protein n=1 Tax=Cylindrotheca closterium TaxID=2856 RepID=A0AAD2CTJ8_9STRA|nr:unnamed protein product [Cylindrotheca closterium]
MGILADLKDQVILCIWIAAMVFAAAKYVFVSRRRNSEVAPWRTSDTKKAVNKAAQEELYEKLHATIMKYKTSVPQEETDSSGDSSQDSSGDIEEGAATTTSEEEEKQLQPRMYSNACAICLEEFEEEEEVTHSIGTKECPHVFHEDCMKEVIVAALRKDIHCIPCPCCRQPFIATEIQAKGEETDV